MNSTEIITLLDAYQADSDKEQQDQAFIRDFVLRQPRFHQRDTAEGHLTASAWISNRERTRAVLLHHGKLDIWVQPGGHIEDDASLQAASLREAREETGINGLQLVQPGIFDIDIHEIPARKTEPAHLHLDIRFWFEADQEALVLSDESHDLRWLTWPEIHQLTDEESVLRMVRKSLRES
ncbi:NUDIX hydrolase [Gynuella sp.]|uniref:NUDIX hydrolase n=1 Tax=Gynuella sp. TaxID=2969146 RepID=UPI003D152590